MLALLAVGMRRLREELGLLGAVVAGAVIRLDQIREQIVLDDEWHALHAILRFGYGRILTHFGWTDFCIPLAVFDKVVKDTVGLSEMWMRLPVLLAGIGTLGVIPLMARAWVGRSASTSLAWLLALSPLHVFLSRFARPYAISLFLVMLGGLSLARWWEDGRPKWMRLGVAGFVLAPYFHLSALPAVLAVLGLGLLAAAAPRGAGARRPRVVIRLAAAVVLGLAILVGLPLAVDHAALTYKAGGGHLGVSIAEGSLELMAGTARAPLLVALVAAALGGGILLARERPRLLALLGALALAGPAAIVLTRPVSAGEPIVAVRYCLVALPAGALLIAVALARGEEKLRARGVPCPPGTLTAVTVAGLFLAGPLPRIYARPNNWTNHGWFQYAYDPARLAWHCPEEVPRFYRELARQPPGSLRILEAPWWHAWENVDYPCYQRVHRQYMAIGFVSPVERAASPSGLPRAAELPVLAPGAPFRFRNFVHVSDEAGLRRRAIRYVVFHRSLEVEMGVDSPDYRVDVAPWIAYYRSRYGPPVYEDESQVAFDLTSGRPPERPPRD
jgi:hypothetical protein